MASSQSLTHTQARVTSAIAGIQKDLSTVAQITLGGVAYTPATLIALLQAYVTLVTALIAAHNQVHALVLSESTQRKQMFAILQALFAYVTNSYGSDPNKLGDFGFTPKKKVGVESAATRAASAVKARATRAAKKAALAAVGSPAVPQVAAAPAASSTTTKS
jgi:hypothetical protein